jgi:hypothetical protein
MSAVLALSLLVSVQVATPPEPLTFLGDLDAALDLAHYESRPVYLHLTAKWCVACKTMADEVYTTPEIHERLSRFIRVSLDVESPRGKRAWMDYKVSSLPTALVLRADGASLDRYRVTGLVEAPELATLLDGALAETRPPPAASRDRHGAQASGTEDAEPDLPAWVNYLWFVGCGLITASLWMKFKERYREAPDQ